MVATSSMRDLEKIPVSWFFVAYISKNAPTCINKMVLIPNFLIKTSVKRKYSVCIEFSRLNFVSGFILREMRKLGSLL